jgi:hypothetical protein
MRRGSGQLAAACMIRLECLQTPFMVGHLLPQGLFVLGVDLDVVLGPLTSQPEPHADVVGEIDLLTLRARDELIALGVVDPECDGRVRHVG